MVELLSIQHVHASLTADEIVQKIQEKALSLTRSENGSAYEYQKRTKLEKMDKSFEKALETKVTISRMTQRQGASHAQLLSVDGVPVADAKNKIGKQQKRKNDPPTVATGAMQKSPWLNHPLINRFNFQLTGEEAIAGRKFWVLKFAPKSGNLPTEEFADRLINRLGGIVVVDQLEFEVARLEINLLEQFTILGGLLGNLETLSLIVARQRMEDGTWIDSTSTTRLSGRKLLSAMHFRVSEESFDFKKTSSVSANNPNQLIPRT